MESLQLHRATENYSSYFPHPGYCRQINGTICDVCCNAECNLSDSTSCLSHGAETFWVGVAREAVSHQTRRADHFSRRVESLDLACE